MCCRASLARLKRDYSSSPIVRRRRIKSRAFLFATDGEEVAARGRSEDDTYFSTFAKLGERFGRFLPVADYSGFKAAEENPVEVKAAARCSGLTQSGMGRC